MTSVSESVIQGEIFNGVSGQGFIIEFMIPQFVYNYVAMFLNFVLMYASDDMIVQKKDIYPRKAQK